LRKKDLISFFSFDYNKKRLNNKELGVIITLVLMKGGISNDKSYR